MSLLPTTAPSEQRAVPPPAKMQTEGLCMPNTAPSVSTEDMLAQNGQAIVDGTGNAGVVKTVEDPFVTFSAALVPSSPAVANGALPFGFTFCPVAAAADSADAGSSIPVLRRDPVRCKSCGAFANCYSKVSPETGNWVCVLCLEENQGARDYTSEAAVQSSLELAEAAVDWLPPVVLADQNLGETSAPPIPPVLYAIDESLDEGETKSLRSALLAAIKELPSDTPVGLISYGSSVSVYDLSQLGVATADVLAGTRSPCSQTLKPLLYGSGAYLAPKHVCLPVLEMVVGSLRGCADPSVPGQERERCLGPALEVGVALLRGASARITPGGRILVCAGGHPTLGPGGWPWDEDHPHRAFLVDKAAEHLEYVGSMAAMAGVNVDVLAGSRVPVGAALLEPLVQKCGGVLILHEGFGDGFAADLAEAPARVVGRHGLVDVRASPGVTISRIIGPAEPLPPGAASAHVVGVASGLPIGGRMAAPTVTGALEWSVNACSMRTLEKYHALTGVIRLAEDIPEEHVYFQFVAQYQRADSAGPVTRVMTHRLPTTPSASQYLKSVNPVACAHVTAKLAVLEARRASLSGGRWQHAARRAAAKSARATLLDIARQFGPPAPPLKRQIRALPSELAPLAERMYHLARGPMLGEILGHHDERRALQARFLHAPARLADKMLLPVLYVLRGERDFVEVPPMTLAMQSKDLLLLDHGTDIFIWVGSTLSQDNARVSEMLDAAHNLAEDLSRDRFPNPVIRSFREGSSMARFMSARLVPLHKDSPTEQEARYPLLSLCSPDERKELESKFLFTDDPSFCEWMYSIPLLPLASDSFKMFMEKAGSFSTPPLVNAVITP